MFSVFILKNIISTVVLSLAQKHLPRVQWNFGWFLHHVTIYMYILFSFSVLCLELWHLLSLIFHSSCEFFIFHLSPFNSLTYTQATLPHVILTWKFSRQLSSKSETYFKIFTWFHVKRVLREIHTWRFCLCMPDTNHCH